MATAKKEITNIIIKQMSIKFEDIFNIWKKKFEVASKWKSKNWIRLNVKLIKTKNGKALTETPKSWGRE